MKTETLVIDLPPVVYERLEAQAKKEGMTLEDLCRKILMGLLE